MLLYSTFRFHLTVLNRQFPNFDACLFTSWIVCQVDVAMARHALHQLRLQHAADGTARSPVVRLLF